jgi:hypothetical protein
MPTFEKKTVYHSALRNAGPLEVQITHGFQQSKFKGKPPFITFRVRDDAESYTYTPENEGIEHELAAVVEQTDRSTWLRVHAVGEREGAEMHVETLDSAPAPAATTRRSAPPAAHSPHQDEGTGRPPLAREMWTALEAGRQLIEQFNTMHGREPSDAELRVGLSLFIELQRSEGRRPVYAARNNPAPARTA